MRNSIISAIVASSLLFSGTTGNTKVQASQIAAEAAETVQNFVYIQKQIGCIPSRDRNGCADRGAPYHTSKIKNYQIISIGYSGTGLCGWAAKDIKEGEITTMIYSKPMPGTKAVTYIEVIDFGG